MRFSDQYGVLRDAGHEEEQRFAKFIEKDILPLVQTKSENRFFRFYERLCRDQSDTYEDLWHQPALIPQVWVNWIHYDSKSKERAERAQKEAFRVDFLLRTNDTGEFVVIEIDGSSHFGGQSFVGSSGQVMFEASMDAYTRHLRKDRFVRNLVECPQ